MADPTPPPADRAPLITMTEERLAGELEGYPKTLMMDEWSSVVLSRYWCDYAHKLRAELDAQRRARCQERAAVDRFRASVRGRIEALREAGHEPEAGEWRVMEIWLEQDLNR